MVTAVRLVLCVFALLAWPALGDTAELVNVPIESARFLLVANNHDAAPCEEDVSVTQEATVFAVSPDCGGGSIRLVDGKLVLEASTAAAVLVILRGPTGEATLTTPASASGIVPLVVQSDFPSGNMLPYARTASGGLSSCGDGHLNPVRQLPATCSVLGGEVTSIGDARGDTGLSLAVNPSPGTTYTILEVLTPSDVASVATRADLDAVAEDAAALGSRIDALGDGEAAQDSALAALSASDASQSARIETLANQVATLETRVRRLERKLPPPKPGCGEGADLAFAAPAIALGLRRRRS